MAEQLQILILSFAKDSLYTLAIVYYPHMRNPSSITALCTPPGSGGCVDQKLLKGHVIYSNGARSQ